MTNHCEKHKDKFRIETNLDCPICELEKRVENLENAVMDNVNKFIPKPEAKEEKESELDILIERFVDDYFCEQDDNYVCNYELKRKDCAKEIRELAIRSVTKQYLNSDICSMTVIKKALQEM